MDNGNSEKSSFYAAGLFLVWPFLAFIAALRNRKKPWAKNICWAFVAFFGFTFAIGAENEGADIVRYIADYQSMHHVQMTFASAAEYLSFEEQKDIARPLISLVLSRFTDHSAALTLTYGIIFGFFFSRNMWYVLERLEGKLKPVTILLIACFFLVIPIWDMNGFRMWTAAHIFLYGALPYLCEGKRKGLIIAALSILVHFSFIVPVLALGAYMVMGNLLVVYFGLFISTFFIAEIDLRAFNDFVETYAPLSLQEQTAGYRGEQYVEEYRTGETDTVWYAVYYVRALSWAIMGFLVILFVKGRDFFRENRYWLNLYSYTLLLYSAANILSTLPSGGRFLAVANLFALALVIFYIHNRPRDVLMKRLLWVAVPALLLYILVSIRIGLYSMSATAIMGNPVVAFFTAGENVSLNDVMRMIL